MRYALPTLLLLAAAGLALLPAAGAGLRRCTPAEVVRRAAAHVSTLPPARRRYARYVSLHAVEPERRARYLRLLGLVANSLSSRSDQLVSVPVVDADGILAYLDLEALGIDPDVCDRLGRLGSGPAPFPEPYFHLTEATEREQEYHERVPVGWYYARDRYNPYGWVQIDHAEGRRRERAGDPSVRWVTSSYQEVKRTRPVRGQETVQGGWLERASTIGLVTLTHSEFAVYEYRWFVTNALVEPRYHELLGLGEHLADVERLVGLDEQLTDRLGSQLRGAVLFSAVARRNRILERQPTLARHGRGPYWKSYDFKTSIQLQNVLQDVLVRQADAFEAIFTLPNGLQGYYIADAQGRRLDKADPEIAQMHGTKLGDANVRTAYSCMACHYREHGWIEVDDEVYQLSRRPVLLLADHADRDNPDRGRRIRQRYLTTNPNELVRQDVAFTEGAVRAAAGGLTCAEVSDALQDVVVEYLERPVTVERLAWETGRSPECVLRTIEQSPGLDAAFVGLRTFRRQRRDQVEAGLGHLLQALYKQTGN